MNARLRRVGMYLGLVHTEGAQPVPWWLGAVAAMVGVTLATANNLNILGAIVVVALVGIAVNLAYLAVVQRMGRRSG